MKKKILLAILSAVVLTAIWLIYDNCRIVNTEYTYTSSKVPEAFDGYRICLVTDFHNADNYKKLANTVKKAQPDLIIVGGDLIDMPTEDFSNAVSLMDLLSNICDVYYTYGNHEMWSTTHNDTEVPLIESKLNDVDIEFLNNRVKTIYKGEECINLIGYKDSIYDDADGNFEPHAREDVQRLYDTLDHNILSIMVFHRAQYFEMLADVGYDVVLSGHLHGGHINIPYVREYILNRHFNSDKYLKGEYHYNDSTMYVCGGTEISRGILRVFNTPEIVSVELRSQ